jgi:hypothetical protein
MFVHALLSYWYLSIANVTAFSHLATGFSKEKLTPFYAVHRWRHLRTHEEAA